MPVSVGGLKAQSTEPPFSAPSPPPSAAARPPGHSADNKRVTGIFCQNRGPVQRDAGPYPLVVYPFREGNGTWAGTSSTTRMVSKR